MTECIQLAGGKVHDPANGIDGEVRDLYVEQGRMVETPSSSPRKIDVSGMVVMPGGVDIHCHIAGPKVNLARKLQPEDHRRDPHPGHGTHPLRRRRHRSIHFCHGVPLCHPGLHHRHGSGRHPYRRQAYHRGIP